MLSCKPRWKILGVVLLFTILSGSGIAQDQHSTRIAIVHPSTSSLNSFLALQRDSIIHIPNLTFLALYYAPAGYPAETIRANLHEEENADVEFLIVEGNLNPENLFQDNDCSDDFRRIFEYTDGILFLGGADFPPHIYGEKTSILTNIRNPERHYFEISFLFHLLGGFQDAEFTPLLAERPDYVVNGFCLGMQSINIATGGTMVQDIPSELYAIRYVEDQLRLNPDQQHDSYWDRLYPGEDFPWCSFHRIQPTASSYLLTTNILAKGETPYVCSSHHQTIEELGKDLVVAAKSMDGKVIEVIIHRRYPNAYGFQFHPEPYRLYDPEGKRFRISPQDSNRWNYYEILSQKHSLEFHRKLWHYFSSLF